MTAARRRRSGTAASAPGDSPGRRRFFRLLGLIAAAGLALRIVVAWELAAVNHGRNSVFTPSPLSDLATYWKLSGEIASGVFSGEFYYQPFYYAVFLPAIRILSGDSIVAVIAVQALLGAATVWLVGLIGARVWSRRAGCWAAAFTACSTPLLLYTPFLQNETLQSFNLTALALLTLLALRRPGPGRFAAVGGMLGVAALTRGNASLFLPVLALVLGFGCRRRLGGRRLAAGFGLLLAGWLLVQLPFIVHNTRLRGRLTGPSTAADAVLALGNTPEAPAGGRNPGLPAGPMEYPETYADFMARAAERPVARQMFDWMCREPGAFFELQFRKLLLFWDYREIPNNVSLYGEGEFSRVLRTPLPGAGAVLLPLALTGMLWLAVRAWRGRRWGLLTLYGMILVYWGATALFYILSRFRAPILPLTAVFAGIAVDRLIRSRRGGRKKQFYTGLSLLAAGVFIAVTANDFYRVHLESSVQRLVRPEGIRYRLLDGRELRIDHGPFTGGDWRFVEAVPGTAAGKRFAAVPEGAAGELELMLIADAPGAMLGGRLNGVPFVWAAEHAGLQPCRLPATPLAGTVRLEVESVRGALQLLYDARRDFRRSELDGRPLAGELVWRFRFRPE